MIKAGIPLSNCGLAEPGLRAPMPFPTEYPTRTELRSFSISKLHFRRAGRTGKRAVTMTSSDPIRQAHIYSEACFTLPRNENGGYNRKSFYEYVLDSILESRRLIGTIIQWTVSPKGRNACAANPVRLSVPPRKGCRHV